jgi:hypothetical protein
MKTYGDWMYRVTYSLPHHLLVRGQLYDPAALLSGKNPRYPLCTRLGESQNRSRRLGEDKILDPTGNRTLTPLSSSQWLNRLR